MTNIEKIRESFDQIANITFDNIPDDVAIFQVVYIRDKSDRSEDPDWKRVTSCTSKNMTYFDGVMVRETIDRDLNDY